ncbi:MAG: hypothetical protein DHS20C17_20220 [Cyclobacteriaceae bacterium]|nr:MAG: hypothetical protein DHS20C17_20220 [Cyclobacteriaceae bacterium]
MLLFTGLNSALKGQSFYQYQRAGQLNIYGGVGITKYFGELSNEKQLGDINPYITVGMNLPWYSKWSVRPEFTYYRISAADGNLPENDSRHNRNLSFESDNLELSGLLVYGLHRRDTRRRTSTIRLYLLAGLGITYSNPTAEKDGKKYQLQPLETEGRAYSKFQLVVPLGFGIGVQMTKRWQVGIEMSYRLTFTDHLDDVSTLYRDPASFSNPIAAALADRRPEIGLDKAPAGTPRGNANTNDGYLLFGVKVFHQLPGKGPLRRRF